MIELIGMNAIPLELPPNISVHPVLHVEHTSRLYNQHFDTSDPKPPRPTPIPQVDGSSLIYIDRILHHRKRDAVYQWLDVKRGAPLHETEWQPTRDFDDKDGTITEAFRNFITEHIYYRICIKLSRSTMKRRQ